MTFEQAIQGCYGLQFRQIPADGIMRSFPIDRDSGFAIRFEDCGSFGNWTRDEIFAWDGEKSRPVNVPKPPVKLRGKELNIEQDIMDIGNRLMDQGSPMSEADLDRYIVALTKVIEAK